MKCPKCDSERSSVVDSRSERDAIRRRRECQKCQYRFSTYERIEYVTPMIIKKDGTRESFRREKVRSGIVTACEKRPVNVASIDEAVEAIERRLQELCVKEVESREVGELLMEQLKEIDQIAYVRFASVYREFSDLHQFVEALQSLDYDGLVPDDLLNEVRERTVKGVQSKVSGGAGSKGAVLSLSKAS